MMVLEGLDEVQAAAGSQLGTSPWRIVTQELIDGFAALTGDDQWIHVDGDRAAGGPFGTTIAHGLLTLALVPSMGRQNYEARGARMVVNYGLNRVRFITPVLRGSSLRMTSSLRSIAVVDDAADLTFGHTVELRGHARPACVCETISRCYF